MRYEVRAQHTIYRPSYQVIDTTQITELEVVAVFTDLTYDGVARKRAEDLAAELNAL